MRCIMITTGLSCDEKNGYHQFYKKFQHFKHVFGFICHYINGSYFIFLFCKPILILKFEKMNQKVGY